MDDKELYRQILGVVVPWEVKQIDLKIDQNMVDIYLEWPYLQDGVCPECEKECKIHDRGETSMEAFGYLPIKNVYPLPYTKGDMS